MYISISIDGKVSFRKVIGRNFNSKILTAKENCRMHFCKAYFGYRGHCYIFNLLIESPMKPKVIDSHVFV